jgi:hypothetical protein
MNARFLLLPIAIAALGCQNGAKKGEAASAPQPYKFPHAMHIESGVACVECHAPVLKSTALRANAIDVQLPAKNELCLGCHDPVPDYKPVQRLDAVVRFDHAAHIPRMKGQKDECQGCHAKVAEPGSMKVIVPPMSVCTSCHNHAQDYAVGRCTPCHVDLRRYDKPVKDFSHEAMWLETHGKWARSSVNTCASCHDQTMCATCHTATTRPMPPSVQFPEKVTSEFIHRGDWISRHAIEQMADPTSCTKCHGAGYCQSCHAFQNVAPGGGAGRPLDPHPAGWVGVHGQAARQNIVSCAGCHNQGAQSKCVECHSTGGVNPHPPGWKGTRSQIGGNPTCRVCHKS